MNLRAAVIGTGHLGKHHARILAEMDGVDLVAVVDRDENRAGSIAARHDSKAYTDIENLDVELDLVSIAVPTEAHFSIASHFLERDIPVLVEKPMTSTLEEARRLTALASERGVCLQVGHVERFHPALRAAQKLTIRPAFIESHRLAPFSFRSTDVGVVLDLMIHDLDIVMHLMQSPLESVHAVGGAIISKSEDIASARLGFENGAVANLTASRVSLKAMRRTRVFSRDFLLTLDFDQKFAFLAKKTEAFEEKLAGKWDLLAAASPEELKVLTATAFRDLIEIQHLKLDDEEPLRSELSSFVNAVRTGTPPEVPASVGLRALEAADLVLRDIGSRNW